MYMLPMLMLLTSTATPSAATSAPAVGATVTPAVGATVTPAVVPSVVPNVVSAVALNIAPVVVPTADPNVVPAVGSSAVNPAAELGRLLEAGPPSLLTLVCAPASALTGLVRQLATVIPPVQEALTNAREREPARFWLELLDADRLRAAGIDPASPVTFRIHDVNGPSAELSIGFSGTDRQIEAMLEHLPNEKITRDGKVWTLEGAKDRISLAREGSQLFLRVNPGAESAPIPVTPEVLAGFPTGPGCALAVGLEGKDQRSTGLSAVSLFLPLSGSGGTGSDRIAGDRTSTDGGTGTGERMVTEGDAGTEGGTGSDRGTGTGETLIRMLAVRPLELSLDRSQGAPLLGTSTVTPTLVATLRAPLEEVLKSHLFHDNETAKKIPETKFPVRIDPGLSLAVFGDLQTLVRKGSEASYEWAAAVPVRRRSGLPISGRALARGLMRATKESRWQAERTGSREVKLVKGERTVYVRTAWNRAWAGNSQARVAEAAAGTGQLWGGDRHLARSNDWPLELSASVNLPGAQAFLVHTGVRSRQSLLEISQEADSTLLGPALVGIVAAIAIPNFVSYKQRSQLSELAVNVSAIATAEEAYLAEFDHYLPMEAAPRPVHQLSAEAVPWTGSPGWETLGWRPDGKVRGVYWVEVSADGRKMTVHGEADLDGDGVHAHYIRETGGRLQKLTGDKIH